MNKLFSTFKTFLATSSVLVLAACPSGNAPQSKPSAQGQNTVSRPAPKPKATVALALGGGASKGFAHIGIIKHIPLQQGLIFSVLNDLSFLLNMAYNKCLRHNIFCYF